MKIASIFTLGAAAVLINALPAHAQPMDFTVGGYFTQSLQLVDIDDHDDTAFEDEVLAQNAEIHFKGKTKLDNGTELGFQVQLEAESAGDQIDEHYLYLKGDWGKLIIGAENGVGHLMQVRAPRFIPGLKIFDNSLTEDIYESAYDTHLAADAIEDAHMSTKLEHISGDANKLSYFTPRVGGLQLGASFAPNNADTGGGEHNAGRADASQQEDIVELGVSYKGKARGVGYKLSYTTVEGDTVTPDERKPKSTSTGFALSYGDWVLGGNQSDYEGLDEVSGTYADSDTIETLSYGLKYKMGDSHIGIGVTEGEETHQVPTATSVNGILGADNRVGGDDDDADTDIVRSLGRGPVTQYDEITIGGGRKLADGVHLGFYYTMSEASHEIVSGGIVTAPADDGADDSADDTAGSVTPFTVERNDSEVSSLGITLALKF